MHFLPLKESRKKQLNFAIYYAFERRQQSVACWFIYLLITAQEGGDGKEEMWLGEITL